jgi:hypothetical protein
MAYQGCEQVLRASEEYPFQGSGSSVVHRAGLEGGKMGEKGNLLDMGEEIFANLAEQGPQFWLNYEQYRQSRAQAIQAGVVAEQRSTSVVQGDAAAQATPAKRSEPPDYR